VCDGSVEGPASFSGFRWHFHSKSRFQGANYPRNFGGGRSNWNGRVRRSFEVLPVEVSTTRARTCRIQSGVEHRRKRQQKRKLLLENREFRRDCVRAARNPIRHTHTPKDIHTHTPTLTRTQPNRSPVRTHPLAHTHMHSCTYCLHKV